MAISIPTIQDPQLCRTQWNPQGFYFSQCFLYALGVDNAEPDPTLADREQGHQAVRPLSSSDSGHLPVAPGGGSPDIRPPPRPGKKTNAAGLNRGDARAPRLSSAVTPKPQGRRSPGPPRRPPRPSRGGRNRGRGFPPGAAEPARGLARSPGTRARLPRAAAASARPAEPLGVPARTCPAPRGTRTTRLHPPGGPAAPPARHGATRRFLSAGPAGAGRPCSAPPRPPPPPPPGGRQAAGCEPVAQPVTAARLPAPPQSHNNMAAAASAGSRGWVGGEGADCPPVRQSGRPPGRPSVGANSPPSGTRLCPARLLSPWSAAPLLPGNPSPAALPGAATTHLAPPPEVTS
uniref:Basic salivary proline-rich protein 3-like n=1 Tax=Castor canadensis TaxID=51338 RepID=A0A8B7WEH3_CASCN|nr:basic salivary proline-rich protein 3-like [Castor canadensis]